MKTKLILSVALFAIVFASCKKKETTTSDEPPTNIGSTTGTPVLTYFVSKDSASNGTVANNRVRKFEYNSSKKLIRVWYKQGTSTTYNSRDTVQYNGSGQISKVERFNTGSSIASASYVYNYVAGVLTTVNETGNNGSPFARTRTFTYTAGKLSAQTIVYITGAGGGGPSDITSIVFNGNNMSTANLTGIGAVTITSSTTSPNPYYGLNFNIDDFLNMFNQNNILQVYLTATPTQLFVNNTFTYADGRVATITDASSTPAYVTTVSYVGL
jgi:hypothetical protein